VTKDVNRQSQANGRLRLSESWPFSLRRSNDGRLEFTVKPRQTS
jgi:hypothetical protein